MPEWGSTPNKEKRPQFLNTMDKRRCYATPEGWVFLQEGGQEEVLVAIRNLSTKIGTPNIVEIYLSDRPFANSNLDLNVVFNEKVSIDTSNGTPYLELTGTSFASANGQATYQSGDGTNILVFRYEPQSNDNVRANLTLSSNIELSGGVITGEGNASDTITVNLQAQGWDGATDVRPDLSGITIIK